MVHTTFSLTHTHIREQLTSVFTYHHCNMKWEDIPMHIHTHTHTHTHTHAHTHTHTHAHTHAHTHIHNLTPTHTTMNVATDPHQQNIHTEWHCKSSACMHTHTNHTLMLHTHTHAHRLLLASSWRCVGEKHLGYPHFCPMTRVKTSLTLMPRCSSANKELNPCTHIPTTT